MTSTFIDSPRSSQRPHRMAKEKYFERLLQSTFFVLYASFAVENCLIIVAVIILSQIREAREIGLKSQTHGSGRAVALFSDNDFGDAFIGIRLVRQPIAATASM